MSGPVPTGGCLQRRCLLAWLGGTLAGPATAQPAGGAGDAPAVPGVVALDALRAGGVALLLRHATTTPGIGDPPGFRAGDCTTQRNLSEAGRAEARRIGAWFAQRGLVPAEVRSSAWCRCIDTARLAFGRETLWPALDSFFRQGDGRDEDARLRPLDAALRGIAAGRFEVWVTHQVNITAATGAFVGMGEGVLVRAGEGARGAAATSARPVVVARLAFEG